MKTFKTEIEWTFLPIKPKIDDWVIVAKGDREKMQIVALCENNYSGVRRFYVEILWFNELEDYFYYLDNEGDEEMIFDVVAWVYYKDFVDTTKAAFTNALDHTVIT